VAAALALPQKVGGTFSQKVHVDLALPGAQIPSRQTNCVRTQCSPFRPTNSPTRRRRAVRTITTRGRHGRTKRQPATQRNDQFGEATSPHQRQGDRGSGDDDNAPLERWIRYADLKRAGIVGNWTQLLRLIELQDFPPGTMLSPKVRAWTVSEIEEWLATRPLAGKRHDANTVEAP
jgi:Prophage CP4-57 regulatory protein (AlpA)